MDGLENRTAGRDRQSGAAVLLRYQGAEIARLRQRLDELGWIGALMVELHPIAVGKPLAHMADTLANVLPACLEGNGDAVACLGHCLCPIVRSPEAITNRGSLDQSWQA